MGPVLLIGLLVLTGSLLGSFYLLDRNHSDNDSQTTQEQNQEQSNSKEGSENDADVSPDQQDQNESTDSSEPSNTESDAAVGAQAYPSGPETPSSIMGSSETDIDQMIRRYNTVGHTYPGDIYAQYGAPTIEDFCRILYEEAAAEGVRAEVVFAQSMVETGWLQFGGIVQPDQCNFAGIGATGDSPSASFNTYGTDSVRMGLRAQVQHLKAYASEEALVQECVDPRFSLVTRGTAPDVYDLAGTWATDTEIGETIMDQVDALLAS